MNSKAPHEAANKPAPFRQFRPRSNELEGCGTGPCPCVACCLAPAERSLTVRRHPPRSMKVGRRG